ncbi:MAG TPA: DUF4369 domain-containing protein [Salinimicrobium sp.]|nr:DUF4369 domain-containing protein [Salinimicrobium sp.]
MKKTLIFLLAICFLISCSDNNNLVITGKVDGLKKGTLYLQKIEDTSLLTIDSIIVDGDPAFVFETNIKSPQVLYLYLKKVDNSQYDDRFRFFAEPGEMTINTSLKNFKSDAVITGSKNQEKLADYEKVIQRFNSRRLDLIKAELLAKKDGKKDKLDSINKQFDNLLKRRYLFTVNFALNNKDFEIAPFVAVSDIYDANIKYLDTIYGSLSPEVKNSKYGKSLEELLNERRKAKKE